MEINIKVFKSGTRRATRFVALVGIAVSSACGGGGAVSPGEGNGEGEETPVNPPAAPPSPGSPAPGSPAPTPTTAIVTTPGDNFAPATLTVAPGSTVTWQISGSRHNVTFPTQQPQGGNIPDTESGSASRVFPTVGTYNYLCTRHSGMTGQVIVSASAPPPAAPAPPSPTSPPTSGTIVTATSSGYSPERAEIAPGGTITWEFADGDDGIVFEDDAPPGGNIPQTARGTRVSRTFPAEGDYDYHSLKNDRLEGRIRVR